MQHTYIERPEHHIEINYVIYSKKHLVRMPLIR